MSKRDILAKLDFGQRIAEDEDSLSAYFVETDNWRRLLEGKIDVVYGPKGSGKSALYSLLVQKATTLFDRGILLAPAENPRGTPAFSDLVGDPPTSEQEFVGLWKLYFACLLLATFDEMGLSGSAVEELRQALEQEGLAKGAKNLRALVKAVSDYARRWLKPEAFETSLEVDPHSQHPKAYKGKIIFGEPSAEKSKEGHRSVDSLFATANEALKDNIYSVWILLDRLDVAFAETPQLEQNALRALFRVYLDLSAYKYIQLKIFLRSDIWRRITTSGFREASHITRVVTIDWDRSSLLNLMLRRLLHNDFLAARYGTTDAQVLQTVHSQEQFFYRLFPAQVDEGSKKPSTLDWMLTRTQDGTQKTAPRELIHLLNELRSHQIKRYETGQPEPAGDVLFERQTFKEALPEVSRVRLTQTIYAEYPTLRPRLEALREAKTTQTVDSLAEIWKTTYVDAQSTATSLVDIGFFERRGERDAPEYWVPFLYRDALDMVQGTAE